jgi:hypothetical protein
LRNPIRKQSGQYQRHGSARLSDRLFVPSLQNSASVCHPRCLRPFPLASTRSSRCSFDCCWSGSSLVATSLALVSAPP